MHLWLLENRYFLSKILRADDEELRNQEIRSGIVNKKLGIHKTSKRERPYAGMLKEMGKEIRDALANLFRSSREIPWDWKM